MEAALDVPESVKSNVYFTIEIKVEGFLSVGQNGRKSYTRGFTDEWVVDRDKISLDALLTRLKSQIYWSPNQHVLFWVFDQRVGEDINLDSDSQIAYFLDMYESEKHLMVLATVLNTDVLQPISSTPPESENALPTDKGEENQTPASNEAVAGETAGMEGDENELDLPDVFDVVEEYVGVDDEYIYGFNSKPATEPSKPASEPSNTVNDNAEPPHVEPSSAEPSTAAPSNVVPASAVPTKGASSQPREAVVTDEDPQHVAVIHNTKNPDIRVGAVFPDMLNFRDALREYAIKKGFDVERIKTDSTRYRAHCKHEGCPWRIHASRLQDDRTIQIKVIPFEHNCSTTKLCTGKMATQSWIADRLVDWLRKNPGKGAKAAKEYLEEKYELKLNYSKVWQGHRLAKQKIHGTYNDSLTNNVSESFNAQIKELRGLLVHELVDSLREMIMEKMATRRQIGRVMDDGILPSIIMELNTASNNLRVVKIARGDDDFAEVTLVESDNISRRHTVDLQNHSCSCRKWQLTGKPCNHALAWICANRGKIADYVHEYYSVERFRAAYAGRIPTMKDSTLWPHFNLGYKLYPPKQKRAAGRPKVQRIRGFLEHGRRTVRCKRCKGLGHFEKTCKLAEPDEFSTEEESDNDDMPAPKKRSRTVAFNGNDDAEAAPTDDEQPPKKHKTSKKKTTPKKNAATKKKTSPKKKKTTPKKDTSKKKTKGTPNDTPSQDTTTKGTPKKKKTPKKAPKKKKTPKKKKDLAESSAPRAKVVRNLVEYLNG